VTLAPNNKSTNISAIIGGAVGCELGLSTSSNRANANCHRQRLLSRGERRAPAAAATRLYSSRHANILLPSGHSSPSHGRRGPEPPRAIFQLGHANGTPWSLPLPSSTPKGAISPIVAQSPLSTHNYSSRDTRREYSKFPWFVSIMDILKLHVRWTICSKIQAKARLKHVGLS